jgi:GNAT superfamily N-acetyltransferase
LFDARSGFVVSRIAGCVHSRRRKNCAAVDDGFTLSSMSNLDIRTMRADEIALAVDWAAAEGWNPGRGDAACFATVDPGGFLIGELDGKPAATISCVNYDDAFAFLGFYIVRPEVRGRGHGLRIWNAAIAHAGSRVIGLDGVVAQQENYKKSGFALAYANVRYGGTVSAPAAPRSVVALGDVPFAAVEADDATVFPAPRARFLRAWIGAPGHVGRALVRDGRLAAWGVIRPCRRGRKIGPLVADDRAGAEAVLAALLTDAGGGEFFLDVPSVNGDAVALAESLGLAPVFETARMYTGAIRPVRLERVFGVTTFELG